MNLKSAAILSLATLALAACGKNNDPISQGINHVGDELNKKNTTAQLAGSYASACDPKGLLWAAAGIKAERMVYDFSNNVGKTSKLYSDDGCVNEVGQAAYTGTISVGAPSAAEGSNVLDLNFTKVVVTISNADTVKLLNSPLTPGCGISDWAVGQGRDVTVSAGGATCPIAKPTQVFDILKTDGQTLHFGLADAAHNKATQNARPVQLDMQNSYSKQ